MNLNQIVDMVLRIFIRKGVNWGINKGVGMVKRGGKPDPGGPAHQQQSRQARDLANRAQKAARITRRLGR